MHRISLFIAVGLSTLLIALIWTWLWALLVMALLLACLFVCWALPRAILRVAEYEVAAVYNSEARAFRRFLGPGRHWLVPGLEYVKNRISTAPCLQSGGCKARAAGGVAVDTKWKVIFSLNPLAIPTQSQPTMVRSLSRNPADLLGNHVCNLIQHVIEHYTIDELCSPGIQSRLENRLFRLLNERLQPYGILVSRFNFQEIALPERIQAAIDAAYERKLQAHAEAQALAIRQSAIRSFTQEDLLRQLELERLRILDGKPCQTHLWMGTPSYHPQLIVDGPEREDAPGGYPSQAHNFSGFQPVLSPTKPASSP